MIYLIPLRLQIFEQIFEAPRMYVLAILEVLRRRNFSLQFADVSKKGVQSSVKL